MYGATRLLHTLWHGALGVLYPPRCLGCHRSTETTVFDGTSAQAPLCAGCMRRLARPEPEEVATQLTRLGDAAPALVGAFALWHFDKGGVLQAVHHALKYGERPAYGYTLGKVLGEALRTERLDTDWSVEAVVPLPLHRSRLLDRGYNQSTSLAEGVADALEVPCREDLLVRARPTRSQTRLSREARRRNVAGAFTVTRPEAVEGRRLLLIDDVLTTGATASAAAQSLSTAGAAACYLATLAFAHA